MQSDYKGYFKIHHCNQGWFILWSLSSYKQVTQFLPHYLQVSWIRHDNSAFLAVNNFVYASSGRFKVFHEVIRRPPPSSPRGYGGDLGGRGRRLSSVEEWRLSVNPVELDDSGLYECQVSTTPHISHFMRLTVIGKSDGLTQDHSQDSSLGRGRTMIIHS